jgi:polar amino acid transport system substrate-binding protein
MTAGAFAVPLIVACGEGDAAGKTYVVGATTTGAPFTFVDSSHQPVGAMIDIVQAVAKDARLNTRFEIASLAELIPSLAAHKVDLVCAAMLRTPEREQAISFTNPVYTYGGAVLLPAGETRPCPTLDSLAGLTVGAQAASRFVTQLEEAGVTAIKTYPGLREVMQGLAAGEVQAAYGARPIIAYHLRTAGDMKLRFADEFSPASREEICLATRKNDFELIAKLNVSIARLQAREIQDILVRWNLA